ncbi:TonB-dependent receptor [Exilibacterium tricleocarpae]|uniref:TonB-dependent receptor n=1 Tax=Exilibacterium tricleocarpae TaxID=2591008 RepID=A0A545TZE0_9GAMM|nr:TonB-dependent receptor [Exilibacterium tricleocarpae]TQV82576.1 TonB-dependent receptor [Exilibacterium tricleocarpae]
MKPRTQLSRSIAASIGGATLAGLTAGGAALPVAAQSLEMEEVVVSARRRDETLQEVPISLSSFGGDALEKTGTPDIVQLAESIPNTTLKVSRGTNTTITAFIRGVGQQDPVAGFEAGVGIYVDDVYLNRPQGAVLDVYDVERIEVLRGPQGTLYGRNTIGGAIKYVTRRLGDEPQLRIKGSLGNFSQRDIVATASAPLGDTLRVGGSVASFQRDGFGENLFTGEENYDKDILAARFSLEWSPADALFLRLAADTSTDDSSPKGGHRLTAAPGFPILNDVFDTRAGITQVGSLRKNEVTQDGASLTAEWSLDDVLTLKSITAYREDRSETPIDFDSLPEAFFDVPAIYDNHQFSQELQVLFEGDRLQGVAGVYYLDANAFTAFDVVLSQFGSASFTQGDVDTETWAVFADLNYDLTDTVSVSVGGRFTSDKRASTVVREAFAGSASPFFGNAGAISVTDEVVDADGNQVVPRFSNDRTDEDFTPRVSISWQPQDALHLYASYSAGFKGGGFDPRGNYAVAEIRDGFEPETVDAFEVGVKTTTLDGRLNANIALFFSDYQDVQIPGSEAIDTDGDGVDDSFAGTVTNAGKADISGVELELTAFLSDSLQANAAIGYIDAEYDEFEVLGVNVADDRVFQNTPELTAFYAMTYAVPLAISDHAGELSVTGQIAYRSETHQFEIKNELLDQPGYSLVNASVVWTSDDDKWQVGLHGKNLSDKEYKVAGYNFPTLGPGGTVTAFYGNPRTVTGSVSYNF